MNEPIEVVVNVVGDVTLEKYKGVFKIKPRLSHRDILIRDQFRRELLGKDADLADPSVINVADVFSKIWTHIVDAPSFWKDSNKGLDLLDESPVIEIYKLIADKEREFVEGLKKAAENAAKELAPK